MRIEKRWNRSKSSYVYSFVYYNNRTKGRLRISQKEIIKRYGYRITDKRDAQKIKHELEEDIDTERKRRDRRKSWQKLYHDQKKCLALYEKNMVANKFSERSRASRLSYLNYYVFHFFLNIKKCDRISDWPIYYDEFRLWLEYEARTYREPKHLLTYQTKDHCITALNCLMKFLRQKDMVSTAAICSMFGSRFYNSLGVDHLVSVLEFNSVFEHLQASDVVVATLYRFIYFTGCRFNEAVGLSLKNLFEGKIPSEIIEESLAEYGKSCCGYVHIDSQPENKLIRDPKTKLVPQKPLKGRARIDITRLRPKFTSSNGGEKYWISEPSAWSGLLDLII